MTIIPLASRCRAVYNRGMEQHPYARRTLVPIFLVLGLAVLLLSVPIQAQTSLPGENAPAIAAARSFRPGEILVKFRPEVSALSRESLLAAHGLHALGEIPAIDVQRLAVAVGQEEATAARLRQDPRVAYAELDGLLYIADTFPYDLYLGYQWNLAKIQAPRAWDIITGSTPITIAIGDTGVDGTHPDLQAKMVAGWDVQGNRAIAPNENSDDYGHGTHVAGIAAASTNNGLGVAGVSWGARIMPVKVLVNGSGYDSDVAAGVIWAVEHGARIVNLSLGGTDLDQTLQDAVIYAYNQGALVIAAAGNCGAGCTLGNTYYYNPVFYPAAYPNVIAVAATDSNDATAGFSEHGYFVDLAAPGVSVYSTYRYGYYGPMSGTSMSTPHVAGLAALIWSANPGYTNAQVTYILTSTTDQVGAYPYDGGRNDHYGAGRINAAQAVTVAAPPILTASPQSLYALADDALLPVTQTIRVVNPGYAPLTWTAAISPAVSWLTIAPAVGQAALNAPGEITVVMGKDGLSYGITQTKVIFSSTTPYVQGSPQTVDVTLTYAPQVLRYYIPMLLNP